MRHPRIAFAAALAFIVTSNVGVTHAAPPTGTINCVVTGDTDRPNGNWRLRFLPPISSTPSPNRMQMFTFMKGTCDNSGVTGGKAPITNVEAHLSGKLAEGTTCGTLTSAPVFEKLQLKVRWQSPNGTGRLRTIATSSARFVDADWDDGVEGLVFLSAPLKGAFAGSTATVTLTIDQPEILDPNGICQNAEIDGTAYGDDGGSSIAIQ
jgi:hypothetical protein